MAKTATAKQGGVAILGQHAVVDTGPPTSAALISFSSLVNSFLNTSLNISMLVPYTLVVSLSASS